MYHKYYTEALVLKSRERGEEDKVFVLYTREFGLVIARATAVRSERSRMRYALQSYAHVQIALVKGKSGWRIAGASPVRNFSGSTHGLSTFVKIAELLQRLVTGEEKNMYLFAAVADAHKALMEESKKAHASIEIVCVARMLYTLGYLSKEALGATLFTHTAYAGELLKEAESMRETLLARINRAIAEAQL
ncbi:hypothetical protein C4585_01735 [Candidatus Parcubacteria bacterium]|nr:MAG: hypothetical protein C4585_01735 [Candidatus Parcubacteria bacterium]